VRAREERDGLLESRKQKREERGYEVGGLERGREAGKEGYYVWTLVNFHM